MAEDDALLPLVVEDLNHSINDVPLLHEISFRIDHDRPTVVLGPNGAGKSLLIRLLHGLIERQQGRMTWNGRDDASSIRPYQTMVFQKPVMFRRSVAANLEMVLKLQEGHMGAALEHWLERAGLAHKSGQSARSLSGGEQQKLALVRALACRPKMLFLDEATASLDPVATRQIEEIVMEAAQSGIKVIAITHDFGQARRLAHDILFMANGRIIEHSPASTFFDAPQTRLARAFLDGEIIER